MLEISFRFIEGTLFDGDVCFCLVQHRHRLVQLGLRGVLFRDEVLRPFRGYLRELEPGARVGQIALRLRDGGLENDRIDLCDHLARLNR